MATTPEQRSKHPLCGAKKKNGELCRAYAGQHTDHLGIGKCKYHGGRMQNHNKHAVAVMASQRMVKMGVPLEGVTSRAALLGLLRATAGHVAWLHAELGGTEDLGSIDGQVIVKLYSAERDRLANIAKACHDAGIDEDTIRIAESEIALMGQALMAACETAGLDAETRRSLADALRAELGKHDVAPAEQVAASGPFA